MSQRYTWSIIITSLSIICLPNRLCLAIETDELVRENVLAAILANESFPIVELIANVEVKGAVYEKALVTKIGNKVRFEGDAIVGKTEEEKSASRKRIEARQKMLRYDARESLTFDGKRVWFYTPIRLEFNVYSIDELTEYPRLQFVNPQNWCKFAFRVDSSVARQVIPHLESAKIDEDTYRFSKSYPPNNDSPLLYHQIEIIARKSRGWNIESWKFRGGSYDGQNIEVDWDRVDSRWYPKKGKATRHGELVADWEILEIGFDVKSAANRLSYNASEMPIGIKIVEGAPGSVQKTTFVGGEAGVTQHRLMMSSQLLERK
jgi:hypothetical protein